MISNAQGIKCLHNAYLKHFVLKGAKLTRGPFDVILLDEAQDANAVSRACVREGCLPACKHVQHVLHVLTALCAVPCR